MDISNINKFHKDNMDYNLEEDYFTCYAQQKLFYQKTDIRWNDKKQDYDIQRVYSNKKACKSCKYAKECCDNKYRVVKFSGGILALNMLAKFDDYSNVLEYVKKFSTVEAPNGTLRLFYHINEFQTTGKVKIQNRINICGGSYNLKRIYNQFLKMDGIDERNILEVTKKFCEYTNGVMFIWQNTSLPLFDKVLKLPYICESSMIDDSISQSVAESQTVLVDLKT